MKMFIGVAMVSIFAVPFIAEAYNLFASVAADLAAVSATLSTIAQ